MTHAVVTFRHLEKPEGHAFNFEVSSVTVDDDKVNLYDAEVLEQEQDDPLVSLLGIGAGGAMAVAWDLKHVLRVELDGEVLFDATG